MTLRVDAALSAIEVLPLDSPSGGRYGAIRARLEAIGTPIGPNDLLIAAHVLSENLILVTNNLNEFQPVEGLSIVNWRQDA